MSNPFLGTFVRAEWITIGSSFTRWILDQARNYLKEKIRAILTSSKFILTKRYPKHMCFFMFFEKHMHLRALNKICFFHLIELLISGGGYIITTKEQNITKQHLRMTRWWFQIFFIFIPIWGRFPFWRAYFSKGLKPPTRWCLMCSLSCSNPQTPPLVAVTLCQVDLFAYDRDH